MKKDEHYLDNLVEYVKRNLKKGYDKDSLKWALINQKHARLEVDKAIRMAEDQIAKDAAKQKPVVIPKVEIIEPKMEKKSFFSRMLGK